MSQRLAGRRRMQRNPDIHRHAHGTLDGGELAELEPVLTVDALGTFCPEPVIRTQDRIGEIPGGGVLLLLADDAGVEIDIPAWCISTGNEYLGLLKEAERYRVFVRKWSDQARGGGFENYP